MIHKAGNYCCKDPEHLADGDIVIGGNYSQHTPGTEIAADVKTLVIRGGNWGNVKPQPTWTIEGGNWAQIERCSHRRSNQVLVRNGLPKCTARCRHRSANPVETVVDYDRAVAEKNNPDLAQTLVADKRGIQVARYVIRRHVYRDRVLSARRSARETRNV